MSCEMEPRIVFLAVCCICASPRVCPPTVSTAVVVRQTESRQEQTRRALQRSSGITQLSRQCSVPAHTQLCVCVCRCCSHFKGQTSSDDEEEAGGVDFDGETIVAGSGSFSLLTASIPAITLTLSHMGGRKMRSFRLSDSIDPQGWRIAQGYRNCPVWAQVCKRH